MQFTIYGNTFMHLLRINVVLDCAEKPVLVHDSFVPQPEMVKCNPDGHQTDPIAVAYSTSLFDQRLLAMADYDGYVSMVNTAEVLPDCINVIDEPEQNVKAQWVAHNNAINDLCFIKVCAFSVSAEVVNMPCRLIKIQPWLPHLSLHDRESAQRFGDILCQCRETGSYSQQQQTSIYGSGTQ
jgi:hypothetical protein